jgi:hypothetical protein
VVDGAVIWTEWEMTGVRRDGGQFAMRGVVIFGITDGVVAWARFFLEPVDSSSGDIDAATSRILGT